MKSPSKPVDFHQHIDLHVKTLKLSGLWFYIPYPTLSIWFWLHILIRVVYGIFAFTIPPLAQIAYVVKLLSSDDLEIQHIASSINLILTELFVSIKLFDMFHQRDLITKLFGQLNGVDFQRSTHRHILERAIKLSRTLYWVLFLGASMDVFVHMVVVPSLNRFRTLPVNMDFIFFDVNEPPYFYYACFYQIIYKPLIVVLCVTMQTLPWSLLSFAIAQLDNLANNFKNMKTLTRTTMAERKCDKNDAFRVLFDRFILQHRAIIRFVATAEKAFGGQFAVTLILSAGIICTTGVQFLSIESPSKDLVSVCWIMAYMMILALMLFGDCYFGNAIYVKSTELATAAYSCPWLEMPKDLKKNLVLVIARAQKPLALTAYNLVTVSLPTFTTVMNWTYKAFAVMNGMK
ncbi:odorant receptor 67a-like [Leguminivora glycinivorella]|uniref:odorant receptor 67a-like n=1 Tax=Leguminivora glycinivorella TaxID=1035111 RepID=UPI00200BCC9D|nr:odorant receptor 67a-like [Leguminivora glycinivorella]